MFERIEVASSTRPWTTALAFLINATFLTAAILLPLVRPDQLPALNFRTVSLPYTAQQPVETAAPPASSRTAATAFNETALRPPGPIPTRIDMSPDPAGPAQPFIPGANGFGPANAISGFPPILATPNPPAITPPVRPATPTVFKISHLDEGMLIRRVQPVYPPMALAIHREGTVVLAALIGTNGEIEHLTVVSGHPLLVRAALEAVSQWRYRPYLLNGVPIEVQTQINVNFNLQQR